MKTNRARIATVAVAVALVLTGCAGGSQAADPKVTPPAGAVATSAPSPTPTTPAPPTQSLRRTSEEAAAIAVVRAYVDEYNEALQSGSTTAFRATFKKSCPLCLGDANTIDATFGSKQRLRGLQVTLDSPRVTLHESHLIFVEGGLSQARGQVLSASGAVVKSFKPVATFRFLWRVKPGPSPVIIRSENR